VVDALPRPERLEDRVSEAEDQDVLDGLLAEVVVDPEDCRSSRTRAMSEFSSCAEARSRPNGFSMTTRVHGLALPARRKPAASSCPRSGANAGRGRREIEDPVAGGPARAVDLGEPRSETAVRVGHR